MIIYPELIKNSLFSALAIPLYNHDVLMSMRIFRHHDTLAIITNSTFGSVIGYFINYCIGAVAMLATKKSTRYAQINSDLIKISNIIKIITLIIFPNIGMIGHCGMVIYGYAKFKPWLFLVLVAISRFCFIYLIY